MNSSETSAKYSWPRREQKDEIQLSGTPDEVDILDGKGPRRRGGAGLESEDRVG